MLYIQKSRIRYWVNPLSLFIVCFAVLSCTPIFHTSSLDISTQAINKTFCTNPTNVYALPKAELDFKVTKVRLGTTGRFRYLLQPTSGKFLKFVADSKHKYCLDYKPNPFYADNIQVVTEDDSRLKAVRSNSDDRSDEIIESITEAVGIGVASGRSSDLGARAFGNDGTKVGEAEVIQFNFDPFDPNLLEATNKALAFTGHCIYFDSYEDPFIPNWMGNHCGQTKVYKHSRSKTSDNAVFHNSQFEAGDGRLGILYKPVLPHTLVIMKRDDPTSSNPWREWKRLVVEMPNRAPPFLLEINRSVFVDRQTEVVFNEGLLDTVKISKESEYKAAAELILSVVKVVVQIPAKALVIATNDAQNRQALIETNQRLILTLAEARAERDKLNERVSGLTPEQQAAAIAAGVLPRSATSRALSLESCIQNALLNGIDDGRELCLRQEGLSE